MAVFQSATCVRSPSQIAWIPHTAHTASIEDKLGSPLRSVTEDAVATTATGSAVPTVVAGGCVSLSTYSRRNKKTNSPPIANPSKIQDGTLESSEVLTRSLDRLDAILRGRFRPNDCRDGHGRAVRVGQGQQDLRASKFAKQSLAFRVETYPGVMARAMINRDGFPTEFGPDSSGKSLGDSFFSRKPCREVFMRESRLRTVGTLLVRKNPRKKAVALSLQDTADPRNIDQVRTQSKKNAARGKVELYHGFILAFISRTASSIPVKRARPIMLCPMFSSCTNGRIRTSGILT